MLAHTAEAQVCVTGAQRFDGMEAKPASDDQKRDKNASASDPSCPTPHT